MIDRQIVQTTALASQILFLRDNTTQRTSLSQVITIPFATRITQLRILMNRAGTPAGNIYVEMYSGSIFGAGTLLGTSQGVTASAISGSAVNVDFIFRDSIAVPQGDIWIRIYGSYAFSATNLIAIRGATPSAYSGTCGYSTDDVNYSLYDGDIGVIVVGLGVKWYFDQSATGLANGTSPENAWTTLAQAFAEPSYLQGDLILVRGSFLLPALSVAITQPTVNREFVSVGSTWEEDGTQVTLDCNGFASLYGFSSTSIRTTAFRGFRITNWTGSLLGGSTSYLRLEKCLCELGGSIVTFGGGTAGLLSINCEFRNLLGVTSGAAVASSQFFNCKFFNITTFGNPVNVFVFGCLFYDCGSGPYASTTAMIIGCTFDGFSSYAFGGITLYASKNRITNCDIGAIITTSVGYFIDNYFSGNRLDISKTAGFIIEGSGNVQGTLDGYTDRANKDFSLLPSAISRRAGLQLLTLTNKHYYTSGLQSKDDPYPRIDSLDKTVLPTSGGTLIGTGIGLTGATGFTLGGTACTVVVDSDTQITITVPAITAGLKSLTGTVTAGPISITNAITIQAAAGAPDAFTISCQPENYDSIKVNISLSSNAIYYVVYRNGVAVSPNIKSHYYIDASGPGTFSYFVRAYGVTTYTQSNTVSITRDNTGFVDLTSMITFIMKMLLNEQKKVVESGVAYLVTYDDDNVNIICKQPLKTFLGNNVVIAENTGIPEQRLRSLIYSVGTINEADFTNLMTMLTKDHFFMKKIVERPAASGVKQFALYDADNTTVLHSNRLKTFNGNDLGDLRSSTAPVIREKSVL